MKNNTDEHELVPKSVPKGTDNMVPDQFPSDNSSRIIRVVLADDSNLIMDRLQDMVSRIPQTEIVSSCKNGKDTVEAIRNLKPDLAIVDIKMPGMSGLQVLTEIRKEDTDVTFVILTFYSSDYNRRLAMEGGADYFFSKADDFQKVTGVLAEMQGKEERRKDVNRGNSSAVIR